MIIISTIVICLISLGIIGYNVEKNKSVEPNNVKTEENLDGVIEEEKLEVNIDEFDISKIDGYTPGQDLVDKNLEENNDEEVINVGGISLPYNFNNKYMEIVSIGKYSGKFIEDGSDINKENVLAIIVKNTSEEVIDYGEINMKIKNKKDKLTFKLTNLKPGACALVMESSGSIGFNSDDKYVSLSAKSNMISELFTMESQIEVTSEDGKITIKNLSEENLNTVYVYYKTISPGDCYLGGITYRARFENMEAGQSVSTNTLHFYNSNSEILKVESVE